MKKTEGPVGVSVFPRNFGRVRGYDVAVIRGTATVQDYLNAVNHAFLYADLARRRNTGEDCLGCDRCCAERVPLTIVDCFQLMSALEPRSLNAFLSLYTTVKVTGPVVDITLRLLGDGYCTFLNRETRTCRVYPVRPFVCQSFRCCPATRRALALREAVVNKGEDELVRRWLKTLRITHYAERSSVKEADWPKTPFCGKRRYDLVPLRGVLSEKLWRELSVQK